MFSYPAAICQLQANWAGLNHARLTAINFFGYLQKDKICKIQVQ